MSNDDLDPREAGPHTRGTTRPEPGDQPDDAGSSAPRHRGASVMSGAGAKKETVTADEVDAESSGDAMSAEKERTKDEKAGSFWKELPILIVIALVLAFVIKTWVVQAFYIPSKSMENTLLVGDRVLVNKLVYQVRDIERGDVVVFNGTGSWDEENTVTVEPPSNPVSQLFTWVGQQFGVAPTGKDYIKRVIGIPGDTVECCDDQNRVMVNGEPIDEPYLFPGSQETHTEFGPVEVPAGRLWLMGDHREISYDSRLHQNDPGGGSVAIESVVGRAFVVVWPLNRITTLPIPDSFAPLNSEDSAAAPVAQGAAAALPLALGAAGALPVHRAGRLVARRIRGAHAGDSAD
ncbi:signal peptidase I [Nocardiopsis sediminis]|uniref:Signal peptidase I n=1 Tax=Nocardiopsis sediminis TaxID=1778267 RepID=A0ABV8FUI3_9ACTN